MTPSLLNTFWWFIARAERSREHENSQRARLSPDWLARGRWHWETKLLVYILPLRGGQTGSAMRDFKHSCGISTLDVYPLTEWFCWLLRSTVVGMWSSPNFRSQDLITVLKKGLTNYCVFPEKYHIKRQSELQIYNEISSLHKRDTSESIEQIFKAIDFTEDCGFSVLNPRQLPLYRSNLQLIWLSLVRNCTSCKFVT